MNPRPEILAVLAIVAPSINFYASRTRDDNFRWDGDGPDPIENGFYPYDVTVTARAIRFGQMIEGNAYLGGSYYEPHEPLGEIHGYLNQMLDEALTQLANQVTGIGLQIDAARVALKAAMRTAYNAQMEAR